MPPSRSAPVADGFRSSSPRFDERGFSFLPLSEPADVQTAQTVNPTQGSLLEELDARQDEVLAGLDDLNLRIEQAISSWLAKSTPAPE